jgi:hypothetical protein
MNNLLYVSTRFNKFFTLMKIMTLRQRERLKQKRDGWMDGQIDRQKEMDIHTDG